MNYWKKYRDQIKAKFISNHPYDYARNDTLRCVYCGAYLMDGDEVNELLSAHPWIDPFPSNASADHVIPLSKGGKETFDNIVPACIDCNRRKQASGLGLSWKPDKLDDSVAEDYQHELAILMNGL